MRAAGGGKGIVRLTPPATDAIIIIAITPFAAGATYMVVWGGQKVVVHGGAGGQRVCNAMDAAIMHVPHKSCTLPRDCPRGTNAVNLN